MVKKMKTTTPINVICNGQIIAKLSNLKDLPFFIENYNKCITWNLDPEKGETPHASFDIGISTQNP